MSRPSPSVSTPIDGDRFELERTVDSELSFSAPGSWQRLRVGRRAADSGEATQRSFQLWHRVAGGEGNSEQAKRIAGAVRHLPNRWPDLRKVEIAVAVEETPEPRPGAFVIFLPTKVKTGVAAHVNAPFYGSLDRRQINFDDSYNALLLEFVADLVLDATLELVEGPPEGWRGCAVIDLVGSGALNDPLRRRAKDRRRPLAGMPLILCDDGWRVPGVARTMPTIPDDDPKELGARRASGLNERCLIDGHPVDRAADGTQTMDAAGLKWLPVVRLAVAAHGGGNPTGPATKAWREAAGRLRRAQVRRCDSMRVELLDGERNVAGSEPKAHWLAAPGILLLDRETAQRGRWEEIAAACQSILDRRDLLKVLRLVLGSLNGNGPPQGPSPGAIAAALDRAEIDAEAAADIRLRWAGETRVLLERLRPLANLLGLAADDHDAGSCATWRRRGGCCVHSPDTWRRPSRRMVRPS